MRWHPFRRAWANPIFQGGLATFRQGNRRCSHGLNYLIILSAVLFITWPKDNFLSLRDLPFAYNALGGSVLIILSYLSFHYGSRKNFISEQLTLHDWLALAPFKAGEFLRGYVAAAGLDIMFFWALTLPLLVLAAGVSGESLSHLGAGLTVILICTSTYRMLAIAMLAWLERSEFVLYMLVRLCYIFIILISGFLVPILNPILAFSGTSIWIQPVEPVQFYGLTLKGWVVTVAIHLLLAGVFFIIALVRWRLVQRRAMSLSAA
ncbi:MAG: hypothetical protein O7G88_18355 [bacterium]|nr:hypothetical protein [bacterium]